MSSFWFTEWTFKIIFLGMKNFIFFLWNLLVTYRKEYFTENILANIVL